VADGFLLPGITGAIASFEIIRSVMTRDNPNFTTTHFHIFLTLEIRRDALPTACRWQHRSSSSFSPAEMIGGLRQSDYLGITVCPRAAALPTIKSEYPFSRGPHPNRKVV
jgi:hypothetical protein